MTPTEISEHTRRAALAFSETGRPREKTWPMIQYGINLAVESKDARIAELEDERDQLRFKCTEHLLTIEDVTQSKDREIERLTTERDMWKATANTSAAHKSAQLTEANAKLAEAEEKILDETRLKEIWIVKASNTADQLSSAQAEIERLKEELRREINIRP